MTTADLDDTTIRRSDATWTTRHATQEATTTWENWVEEHVNAAIEGVQEGVGEIIAGLERKVKGLELGLAQANGALDILRGKGIPGTFNVRGTFDARSVYNRLDVCAYNGASWVAKEDNPGDLPGPKWQLLSAAGKRGVSGERGPQGPVGPASRFFGASFSHKGMGIQTSQGPVPILQRVAVSTEDFTIKFVAADDTTLSISLLPLFEAFQRQTGRGA